MSTNGEKYLIVIAGPTAVGKTALSIQLAKQLQTEIISADSRQFFRELNIGTAKPTDQELALVKHHFINSHSISQGYSAGDFERDALVLLNNMFEKHSCVILTGGSGLYIRAILEGLDDLPQPLPALREKLAKRLELEGLASLQKEIAIIDPDFAATSEIQNPQRVVRAMEVFHTTGTPISRYQKRSSKARDFHPILIALTRDRAELYQRIDLRMDQMLAKGLVTEARDLIGFRTHHALQTVGYKEVYGFFDGLYDEREMVRLLKQNSRRYAKRQLTWFRHQGKFQWFEADAQNEIVAHILSNMGDSQAPAELN
jgi:tRNA dimethylallyltransferase